MNRWSFCVAICVGSSACSSSPVEPAYPTPPDKSLGLAMQPGPCVQGKNVVAASAFATAPGSSSTYLKPADGALRFELTLPGQPSAPVGIRWLDVAEPPGGVPLSGQPWNLELTFNSPSAGECPLHVQFEPSARAAQLGLGRAETTLVMKNPPPPP